MKPAAHSDPKLMSNVLVSDAGWRERWCWQDRLLESGVAVGVFTYDSQNRDWVIELRVMGWEQGRVHWQSPDPDTNIPSRLVKQVILFYCKTRKHSPGWCDSVDWVLACEPKGCWFESQSGHMPELRATSLVWGHVRSNHTLMFLSFSFSLPSPLINK